MNATDFEVFLESWPEDVHEIAHALRKQVLAIFKAPVEEHDAENHGFGFATGYKGSVFVISPAKSSVRLGFPYVANLEDPEGLLEGAGSVHKHVKVRSVADAKAAPLRALLASQLAQRRQAFGTVGNTATKRVATKRGDGTSRGGATKRGAGARRAPAKRAR